MYICTRIAPLGVLAHLARALDWQSKGDRFESDILHTDNQSFTTVL